MEIFTSNGNCSFSGRISNIEADKAGWFKVYLTEPNAHGELLIELSPDDIIFIKDFLRFLE